MSSRNAGANSFSVRKGMGDHDACQSPFFSFLFRMAFR